jgi:hypothetical protein
MQAAGGVTDSRAVTHRDNTTLPCIPRMQTADALAFAYPLNGDVLEEANFARHNDHSPLRDPERKLGMGESMYSKLLRGSPLCRLLLFTLTML